MARRLNWRFLVLIAVLIVGTGGIVVRLVQVQIVDHGYYAAEAEGEHLHRTVVRAPRGALLDRNGYPLATSVAAFDVYVDPRSWANDANALEGASALAPLLRRDAAELIASARAQAQGDYLAAFSVDADVGLTLLADPPPGVKLVETSARSYPEGDLASALLGFIGRDQTGLAGVEAGFDLLLGGVPGEVYFERDALGNPIPFGERIGNEPTAGGDVRLTIDRVLQRLVEQKLKLEVERHQAVGGTIIVMDPMTGEILAMASEPTYQLSKLDPSDPKQSELYRVSALSDVYAPGSVMKTITMAAAIDLGLVSPGSTYMDDGEAEIEGGVSIANWDLSVHGETTMVELLQHSLNTGAVWLSGVLGPDNFYTYVERFGFMDATDVGLGLDPAGLVRTHNDDDWYPIDLATNSFGQGISVTPLHMVTAVSALVNGGLLMRPYIVKEVTGPDDFRTFEPVVVRRAVSEETSRTLIGMMNAVVDGVPTHGAQVAGISVGGKTGTTTFHDRSATIASFVGFAPAENPRFIMLVKIDDPKDSPLGGVVAAPIFSDLTPQVLTYLGAREGAPAHVESTP